MRWNYYKLRQLTLLQSAMDSCHKLRQLFYYKVRHGILPIATCITKCDGFITNCDSTEPDLNLLITFKSPRVHKFLSRGFSVVSVSQQLYPGGPEIKIGMLMLVG